MSLPKLFSSIAGCVAGFATVSVAVDAAPPTLKGQEFLRIPGLQWQLAFSDEFDGPGLDDSKWSHLLPWTGSDGTPRHHNDQYASYIQEHNLELREGAAHLLTRREKVSARDGRVFDYTQAMITTSGKFEIAFGYFEVRVKLPVEAGPGLWPAFWTLQQGWPPEMDICEIWTSTNRSHQGLAYSGPPDAAGARRVAWDDRNTSSALPTGWTTYGMEWGPGYQIYNIDGIVTKEVYGDYVPTGPQYMLLNSGVDSKNPPNETTRFPNAFIVDYVRVYARPDKPVVHAGSFEQNDIRPWKRNGRGAVVATGAADGKQALRLDMVGANAEQLIYGLKPGTTYRVNAQVRCQPGATAAISVDTRQTPATQAHSAVQTYQPIEVTFTTGPETSTATITCSHAAGSGSVFVDDVSITQIDQPASKE